MGVIDNGLKGELGLLAFVKWHMSQACRLLAAAAGCVPGAAWKGVQGLTKSWRRHKALMLPFHVPHQMQPALHNGVSVHPVYINLAPPLP